MTATDIPGQLVTEADGAAAASETARRIAAALVSAIASRGRATLAVSGGNTPRAAYATLAKTPGVDWSKVHVYWVDERAVPPDDDRSNYRWAKATLLDDAAIPPSQVHRMPAEEPDLAAAATAYEIVVKAGVPAGADGVPVFDVMVLGIGDDGHTASIFPGDPTVDVTDRAVIAVPSHQGLEPRLTLSRPVIQHARLALVLVVGAAKVPALTKAWSRRGDLHETPSRLVRDSKGEVVWIVDAAAAAASQG
jgi:6-phosphogluconolactonase